MFNAHQTLLERNFTCSERNFTLSERNVASSEDNFTISERTDTFSKLCDYVRQAFVLTFLAEWGDRSQVTTIAVSACAPLVILLSNNGRVSHIPSVILLSNNQRLSYLSLVIPLCNNERLSYIPLVSPYLTTNGFLNSVVCKHLPFSLESEVVRFAPRRTNAISLTSTLRIHVKSTSSIRTHVKI